MKNLDERKTRYYEVALPLNLKKNLIYSSDRVFQKGQSVVVSLKSKPLSAVVLGECPAPSNPGFTIKPILREDPRRKPLPPLRLKWLLWLARYYHHDPGQTLRLSFPPGAPLKVGVRAGKKERSLRENGAGADPAPAPPVRKPILTEEQERCLREIQLAGQKKPGFCVHFLHGVTGSGKTEIYFRLIEPALQKKQSVLVLVPEIALTPQHIKRFSERFPGETACFHSGLTPRQKREQWTALLNGEKHILIGPRSTLFCPLPRLSWILVDEEHESHFKQEEKLKYHGRDAAIYLGKCLNIPVLLASATPGLESLQNILIGKYLRHRLKHRVFKTPACKIEVVDMRREKTINSGLPYWLSQTLKTALTDALQTGDQSALFLNRRGESTGLFCRTCAYTFNCINCDIALTRHQSSHLLCHYCGYRREEPPVCPECGGEEGFFSFKMGTAGLEKELQNLFPGARIARADRDEIKTHKQWALLLERMEKKQVDILIGTQMIAKGLDFPFLNLVGLMLADQGLNHPDFRSAEKSFQLITQMAGRAGRRKKTGRVILQSYNPSHPVIQNVKTGDYEKWANRELAQRKKYLYPPYGKLSLVRTQSLSPSRALKTAHHIQARLKNIKGLTVLGPAPAPYFKLKNKYRHHLLLKSVSSSVLEQAGRLTLDIARARQTSAVQVHVNRDPVSML